MFYHILSFESSKSYRENVKVMTLEAGYSVFCVLKFCVNAIITFVSAKSLTIKISRLFQLLVDFDYV